jgi:hypothetical protein
MSKPEVAQCAPREQRVGTAEVAAKAAVSQSAPPISPSSQKIAVAQSD